MENKKIQLLASGLIKTWKQDDNIVGFVSHLKNDKKIRHFFTNQSDDDLFKVAMLIQGIKNGFSGRDELKKIEDSLFSFSIITIDTLDPEIECEHCGGDGWVSCDNCGGRGGVTCSHCGGDGEITCSECGGDGQLDDETECHNCDGSGYERCEYCDGDGDVQCDECVYSGRMKCPECIEGYIEGVGRYEIIQNEYISYDTELRDALERKEQFDVISEELSNLIYNSKRTFILNVYSGINDEDLLDGSIRDFEEGVSYLGEVSLETPNIRNISRGSFVDRFLTQFYKPKPLI